jgi:hypothetical protein
LFLAPAPHHRKDGNKHHDDAERPITRLLDSVNGMTMLLKIDPEVCAKIDEKTPGLSAEICSARDRLASLIKETTPDLASKLVS